MRWIKKRNLISLVLMVAGMVLLFLGARDYLGSIWGQFEAARRWRESAPLPQQQYSKTPPSWPPPELGTAFAKLSIPRLGGDWFVFEGTDEKDLRLGPGHMPGTALPGAAGNCVIAGHRDMHFRILKDIRKGDEIVVATHRGEYRYRVTKLSIVRPTNTAALQPTPGSPVMNLITCYPFYYVGPAPKRFVVQAVLEGTENASQPQPPAAKSDNATSGRRTS